MASRVRVLVPTLARARESVDRTYEMLIDVADRAPIPCDAIESYRMARAKVLDVERRLVIEARKLGMHPPEDVPHHFALFGACPANATEIKIERTPREQGKKYIARAKKVAANVDMAMAKAYRENPEFRALAAPMLEYLARYAKAGTPEASPTPPENISLLRLYYFLGGNFWRDIPETNKWLAGETEVVSEADAQRALGEAYALESVTIDYLKEEAPKVSPTVWTLALGGLAVLGTAMIGTTLYYARKDERERQGAFAGREEENVIETTAEVAADALALPAYGGF